VLRYTNLTTVSGTVTLNRTIGRVDRVWLRIRHDGTNLISSYSHDGVNWIQGDSHVKTASFTTDSTHVEYFVTPRGSQTEARMSVLSWVES